MLRSKLETEIRQLQFVLRQAPLSARSDLISKILIKQQTLSSLSSSVSSSISSSISSSSSSSIPSSSNVSKLRQPTIAQTMIAQQRARQLAREALAREALFRNHKRSSDSDLLPVQRSRVDVESLSPESRPSESASSESKPSESTSLQSSESTSLQSSESASLQSSESHALKSISSPLPSKLGMSRESEKMIVDIIGQWAFVKRTPELVEMCTLCPEEFSAITTKRVKTKDPRKISKAYSMQCAENVLGVPRGLAQIVFRDACVREDSRWSGEGLKESVQFNGELSKRQEEAVSKMVQELRAPNSMGVVSCRAECGCGKTVMAIAAFLRLGMKVLWLTGKDHLMWQAKAEMDRFAPGLRIAMIGGKGVHKDMRFKDPANTDVLIASWMSLVSPKAEVHLSAANAKQFGTFVVDEAHHMCARSLVQTYCKYLGQRFGIFLTATPMRSDGLTDQLQMIIGPCVVTMRNTVPVRVTVVPSTYGRSCVVHSRFGINEPKSKVMLSACKRRNDQISEIAANCAASGRFVCIVVAHVAHCEEIARLIQERFSSLPSLPSLPPPPVAAADSANVEIDIEQAILDSVIIEMRESAAAQSAVLAKESMEDEPTKQDDESTKQDDESTKQDDDMEWLTQAAEATEAVESAMLQPKEQQPSLVSIFAAKLSQRERMKAMEAKILIATSTMISEAFNDPKRAAVIIGAPMTNVIQTVGRGRREYPGKTHCDVYDIADAFSPYAQWFFKRVRIYKEEGYEIVNPGAVAAVRSGLAT